MLRNRLLILSLIVGFITLGVNAEETLSNLEFSKPPAFRVGLSDAPEQQYIQAREDSIQRIIAEQEKAQEGVDLTYADLSIKRISKEISQDLEYDSQDMLSDLSLLWQGAAMQSETIGFALYKLANPDADKPDEKSIKRVLSTIASMSTLVGASVGSPLIAGSSLIGGNVLGIFSQDTKALNYKYTKVNDADMIILIRKVEDLQQKTIDLYYDYMSAKKQLELTNELVAQRKHKYELAQVNSISRELVVITDAYYRTALDKQRVAKSEFYSKRAALEQFVGRDALIQFEQELAARENGEKTPIAKTQSKDDVEEENQAVQLAGDYVEIPQLNNSSNEEKVATASNRLTGLSSSIEGEEQSQDDTATKSKKELKAEKKAKEKELKANKNKHNPNLIFLHSGKDKNNKAETEVETGQLQNVYVQPQAETTQQQVPKYDNSGLLPLDAIRVPDSGYSIHSEYMEEINSGDSPSPF